MDNCMRGWSGVFEFNAHHELMGTTGPSRTIDFRKSTTPTYKISPPFIYLSDSAFYSGVH